MKLIRAKDYADVSVKAAAVIASVVTLKPDCVLGLATGSSPVGTYKELIKKYEAGELDFSQVKTVNLDEYVGLSKDHDQSYAYFMRTNLYGTVATLNLGMRILDKEDVAIDRIFGHGGLFKTRGVGQRVLAAAINAPVSVMETAGEGGAWGIALLAAYRLFRAAGNGQLLETYLNEHVFSDMACETIAPDPQDLSGFAAYMDRYVAGLEAEKASLSLH